MIRIAFALLLAAGTAAAQDAPADAPYPLEIEKGKRVELCGKVACPLLGFQCDDPSLVRLETSEKSVVLLGLKTGTTLCAARSSNYQRRVFRVTVN